jgi:hypothetical protein
MPKKIKVFTVILPVIIFLGLFLYSVKSRETMIWLYAKTSYYVLFALCIIWVTQLIRYLEKLDFSLKKFLPAYGTGIGLALVMTCIIFLTIPVQFKILGDETNLLSVSQSMLYQKEAYRISMAHYFHDSLIPIKVDIPNRPLLFPFVTCLIHSVLGYRPQNVFILNFLVMFVCLAGVYVVTRKCLDTYSALAAMFLVLACPIVSIYGTSGGYDLFSTLFFAMILLALYDFLKAPASESLAFIWISLLMFTNIRYESCIFFLLILVPSVKFIKLKYFKSYDYLYALTPVLSLPFIWQRILSQGTYENPPDVPLFALQSFIRHGKIFIQNFLNLQMDLPYAGLLNLFAVVMLGYLAKQILAKKIILKPYQKYFGLILGISIAAFLVIVLSHHFGRFDRPTQARLFLNFSLFCALTPLLLKALSPNWISGKKLLIVSIIVFMLYHPIAARHDFINSLIITRIHQNSQQFLEDLNDRNVLIITDYSGHFTALNYGAVKFEYAKYNLKQLMAELQKHSYSKVIVIQEIAFRTNRSRKKNQLLDPHFKLQTLKEIKVHKDYFIRFSKVVI